MAERRADRKAGRMVAHLAGSMVGNLAVQTVALRADSLADW